MLRFEPGGRDPIAKLLSAGSGEAQPTLVVQEICSGDVPYLRARGEDPPMEVQVLACFKRGIESPYPLEEGSGESANGATKTGGLHGLLVDGSCPNPVATPGSDFPDGQGLESLREGLEDVPEEAGREDHVGIDAEDVRGCGVGDPFIPGLRHARRGNDDPSAVR